MGTAGLVALPTMAAGTLGPGALAPGVMSTSIAAQPIMTASTALLAGNVSLSVSYMLVMLHIFFIAVCKCVHRSPPPPSLFFWCCFNFVALCYTGF